MLGNNSFKVGIDIRLSRDDGNLESDSIISQRSLLRRYVKENNYIVVDEYVDDGYSGTNFDRPSFKSMMNDIELGKINMIITKDHNKVTGVKINDDGTARIQAVLVPKSLYDNYYKNKESNTK